MPFGRRNAAPMPQPVHASEQRIDTPPPAPTRSADRPILVRQSAFDAADPYPLVQSVVDFVNFALRTAYFNRDEIAPNALRAYHADYYLAQVNNGGHGQYAANSQMISITLSDAQEGLVAMRHRTAGIHQHFLDYSRDEPIRFKAVMAGAGFGKIDPIIQGFDEQFYAINNETPMIAANNAWLKSLPELRVVPDERYADETYGFASANPQAAFRKADRERELREADANDPLKQALTYLCLMAQQPRIFKAWVAGKPGHDLGDGNKVVRWSIVTDRGPCSAFFHPKISILFDDTVSKQPPIAEVPTEMVLSYVKEATGKNLFDALPPASR